MSFSNRLERIFGRLAIPNLPLILVLGQVFFWGASMLGQFNLENIALRPASVMAGEYWRLVSFLWLPPPYHPVFLAFAWYLFWMMGSALEQHWGVFRFNLFLFTGWVLTVAVSFLVPNAYTTNVYLAGSVFLAFAVLNPDFVLMLFFILPVKIKWLALLQAALYGYQVLVGSWPAKLAVLASVGNFLLFFSGEFVQRLRTGRRRMEHQARVEAARAAAEREPRHRCVVCGKNDLTHPMEDFRYSDDDQCYCSEHRPGAQRKT